MIKTMRRIMLGVISIIITLFRKPKKKVKEVVNVKYPVHKKAS